MSRLLGYFQSPKVDSEGQLRAAQQTTYSQQQEQQARQAGFRSADEMMVYMRARQQKGSANPRSRKLNLQDMLSWHPTNTLNRASSAMRSARGKDE